MGPPPKITFDDDRCKNRRCSGFWFSFLDDNECYRDFANYDLPI